MDLVEGTKFRIAFVDLDKTDCVTMVAFDLMPNEAVEKVFS